MRSGYYYSAKEVIFFKRATIFAKACFGHPSPSKRQKSRGNQCLRRPDTSCVRVTTSHHCKLDADSV